MNPHLLPNFSKTADNNWRIPLRKNGKVDFLPIENIEQIQAARNYSIIYSLNGAIWVSSKTLLAFDTLLNPSGQFLRLHRSCLVNLSLILDCFQDQESFVVLLKNGKKIKVARRYVKQVRAAIVNLKYA